MGIQVDGIVIMLTSTILVDCGSIVVVTISMGPTSSCSTSSVTLVGIALTAARVRFSHKNQTFVWILFV